MDSIEFRPTQRRTLLIWTWSGGFLVLVGIAGIALAPHVPGGWTGLLFLPGLLGLVIAPLTFNVASGHTVLSAHGIRTGTLFSRHACPWSEVAAVDTKEIKARSSADTRVLVVLTSGKSFTLAAPFDSSNGRDPEFSRKLAQIQGYWAVQRESGGAEAATDPAS